MRNGSTTAGTSLQLYACNGTNAQKLTRTDRGELRSNLGADLCVDVANAGTASGTRVQLWPCNGTNAQQWFDPPKLPVTDLNGSPITISAVSLNNGSNLLVGVQPGQTISVTFTYTIAQMASCPYCIDQIMIGFPDQFLGCVYNGIPSASGVAGTGSLSLSAPATPGVYYLRFHYAMGYYCAAGSWSIWPATEANDIAVITVR